MKLRLKEAEQELSGVEQTIQKVARDTMALQERIEEQMSQQSCARCRSGRERWRRQGTVSAGHFTVQRLKKVAITSD